MTVKRPLYALDIETDTAAEQIDPKYPPGLDPRTSAITSVAIYSPVGSVVFDDPDEARMLRTVASWLHADSTVPGVIVTWNGANFDLPYLTERAARCGVELGFELQPTDLRPPKYEPLPGHSGGYLARVGKHGHADIAYAYKDWAAANGVAWSLKPVAAAHHIAAITVDRARMDQLSVAERLAYNFSDVVATHRLAELLGDRLEAHIDQFG